MGKLLIIDEWRDREWAKRNHSSMHFINSPGDRKWKWAVRRKGSATWQMLSVLRMDAETFFNSLEPETQREFEIVEYSKLTVDAENAVDGVVGDAVDGSSDTPSKT